ncbi:MAG: hypothetical protein R2729_18100 [Bryobacteraceae bacterium]
MNLSRILLASMPALLAAADIPPAAQQIAAATQAAPKDRQAEAAVLGYNADGKLVTLREGKNELVCLASDPAAANYSVACYHKDLEPFMARGRELAAQGLKGMDRHKARWKEVDEGKVKMSREPRMLYVLAGKGFDAAKSETIAPFLRWVVYVPYATPESTGLPIKGTTEPWLMYPGTAGAHIMITPPRPK